ncbi:hypothetical protein HID58_095950 [Brassica napus]|uniref:Uncharacterized protein n=1 Tax=Brassica napus TaxID=3708 RepID=A0ABQ7X1Z8_BRANA|nr:hypothetical protein HID58_095950 [Brassica napus]
MPPNTKLLPSLVFLLSLSLSLTKPSPPLSLSSTGIFESNSASNDPCPRRTIFPRSFSPAAAAAVVLAASVPVVPPISRHLAFASTKPPFHPSDNYHRFTPSHLTNNLVNGCGGLVDREEDAVVLRSPVSSPRSRRERRLWMWLLLLRFYYNGFTSSDGFTAVPADSCFSKGGRVNIKSKSKVNQSIPQTPISNIGKKERTTLLVSCHTKLLLEVAVMTVL